MGRSESGHVQLVGVIFPEIPQGALGPLSLTGQRRLTLGLEDFANPGKRVVLLAQLADALQSRAFTGGKRTRQRWIGAALRIRMGKGNGQFGYHAGQPGKLVLLPGDHGLELGKFVAHGHERGPVTFGMLGQGFVPDVARTLSGVFGDPAHDGTPGAKQAFRQCTSAW